MNEPWGDEPTELFRLYEDAAVVLRRADPSAILFVSPHALISAGGKSGLRRPTFGNFVYSPHFYDAGVVTLKTWFGNAIDGPFDNMRSLAQAWGVPLFVGEFGGSAQTVNGRAYVAANYDELDETLASGVQWNFTPGWTATHKDGWNDEDLSVVDGTGAARETLVPRPFPRRIAGTPGHFFVDSAGTPGERHVELAWEHDPATGVTEIYVPMLELFGTQTVSLRTDGAQLACVAQGDFVYCQSPVAGPKLVEISR
jgi:endoglycosylceramidase